MIGIFSESILNFLLKQLFKRTRPFFFDVNFKLLISMPKGYSFPSGHTFMAFTVATIIFGYDEKLGLNAYILAIIIAYSRLYFYVCYPSDVIAGLVFGLALESLVSYVSHKINN